MKEQFSLEEVYPKPKAIGNGVINFDVKSRKAIFFLIADGEKYMVAAMTNATIESIGENGIVIVGLVPAGFDRKKQERFYRQKWILSYL